jgi:hypothetical protein
MLHCMSLLLAQNGHPDTLSVNVIDWMPSDVRF